MKRLINLKSVCAALALFLTIGAADASAQRRPALKRKPIVKKRVVPAVPVYAVASGTTMRVRMNQTITSKTASVGHTFTATVTEPVYSTNGVVVIPTGSTVTGRVDMVQRAANGGKVGQIDASFNRVRLPNGTSRAINGSLTSLEADGIITDNEGTASGKKMNNRKVIFIGGGGVGGAVLGGAIGGGKGALIGGLLGAGAGFIGDRYTKGKEAEVKSGTEFGVILNQAISLPRFVETTVNMQ
ncbi:MAG: hypothetical protein ABR530_09400 [Pyrinomonadaceae bacterium]